MKPTRSAKSTETSRRSVAGSGSGAAATSAGAAPVAPAEVADAAAASVAPHSPQKRTPGSFALPQVPHRTASGVPQAPQNFLPGPLSAPHDAQRIGQTVSRAGTGFDTPGAAINPRAFAADTCGDMTAVQCSYDELLDGRERADAMRDRVEALDEDQALVLVATRYGRYLSLGVDWECALLLAVDLDAAA